jgi:NAD(P)-dependent dehydrogenase (short-subunit alcohol dehydrogenase family)
VNTTALIRGGKGAEVHLASPTGNEVAAALVSLTRQLAIEYAEHGIRVKD